MAEKQPEPKWCKNCKRDIAAANFLVHEVHCQRNIVLCEVCEEPVPKSELQEHFQEYHAPVSCPLCHTDVSREQLQTHQDNDCPKRVLQCVYCELEMPQCDLQSHLDYCGTRTEVCDRCHKYIMHKDRVRHDDTDCTLTAHKPTIPRSISGPTRPGNLRTASQPGQDYISPFAMDELSRILQEPALNAPAGPGRKGTTPKLNNVSGAQSVRAGREVSTHNDIQGTSRHRPAQRAAAPKQSNRELEMGEDRGLRQYGNNLDRDQLLAMQLELDPEEADLKPPDTGHGELAHLGTAEDTILPCEFCDVLFSSDDLIQHQSVCIVEPMSSSPPRVTEEDHNVFTRPNNSPGRDSSTRRAQPQILDNLAYLAAQDRLASGDPNDQHLNPGLDEDFMLPCEFCDVLLPEYVLIQHQAICDNSTRRRPSLPRISPTSPVSPGGHNRTGLKKTGSNRAGQYRAKSKPDVNVRRKPDAPTNHRDYGTSPQAGSARGAPHWQFSGPRYNPQSPASKHDGGQHNARARNVAGGSSITGVPRRAHRPRPNLWDDSTDEEPMVAGRPSYSGKQEENDRIHQHAQGVRANVDRKLRYRESSGQPNDQPARPSYHNSVPRRNSDIERFSSHSHSDTRASGVNHRPKPKPRIVAPMRAEADFSEAGYNMRLGLPPQHSENGQSRNGARGGPPNRHRVGATQLYRACHTVTFYQRPQQQTRRHPQGDV